MVLRAGYLVIAQKLQESASKMSTDDVRTRLSDCLNDAFRGTGNWCYVVAVFGDDKSGDVVYSCNSDLKKASYTIANNSTKIDTAAAIDVQPLTTYEPEAIEATEAGARNSKRDLRQLQTIHDSAAALGLTARWLNLRADAAFRRLVEQQASRAMAPRMALEDRATRQRTLPTVPAPLHGANRQVQKPVRIAKQVYNWLSRLRHWKPLYYVRRGRITKSS